MVCLEICFEEKDRFDIELYLIQNQIRYFDKIDEDTGKIELYIAERELSVTKEKLKSCEYVNRVRKLTVNEVLI